MASVGKLFACFLLFVALADAKHCRESGRDTWQHGGGSFEKEEGTNKWNEYDKDRNKKATFTQGTDNGRQVIITDKARSVSIVLQDGVAGINHDGGSQYQQLYKGGWATGYDCT